MFFSRRVPAPAGFAAGIRPRRQIGRQIDLKAIGKFDIERCPCVVSPPRAKSQERAKEKSAQPKPFSAPGVH
jgi:hypothetical protein